MSVSRVWTSHLIGPFYIDMSTAKRDFKVVCCLLILSSRLKGNRNLRTIRPVYTKHFETFRRAHVESPTVLTLTRAQQVKLFMYTTKLTNQQVMVQYYIALIQS